MIATARSGGDNDSDLLAEPAACMGTPSYMAPEQARGEVDRLDERCDVFALGSILCEILTGEPAFTGRSSGEIQRKASRGELKESLIALTPAAADAELIALAKDCLAPELEDRPRHAGVTTSGSQFIGPAWKNGCVWPTSPAPRKKPALRKPPSALGSARPPSSHGRPSHFDSRPHRTGWWRLGLSRSAPGWTASKG